MFGVRQKTTKVGKEEETDPERIYKLKECCDLLVAAGYFRARLPGLVPFDRVVGGIVWAITGSGVDLNVDLLFEENATIGQRIKLADKLVKALLQMKCPTAIQSQQIQGLHYDTLFAVIQWLVRKVIEIRSLTGDLVRQLAVSQFGKEYALPNDQPNPEAQKFLSQVIHNYAPTRKFKKRTNANFESEVARTEATLLEYGEKIYRPVSVDEESADLAAARKQQGGRLAAKQQQDEEKRKKQEEDEKKKSEEDKARIEQLKKQLAEIEGESKVSGSEVGKLVGLGADEIRKAIAEYEDALKVTEETQSQDKERAPQSKAGLLRQHQRAVEGLNKKIAEAEAVLNKKISQFEEGKQKVQALEHDIKKKTHYNQRVVNETAKLEAIGNAAENKEVLEQLKGLVMLNETLKQQEAQFKTTCKQQRDELMAMIAKVESGEVDEESKKMKEIESLYESDKAKLDKLRAVLAAKNQAIAKIARDIDDIPTRAELLQYERRFVELYELVAEKLVETRKYYDMYNTLDESLSYVNNEVQLLESIIEGFPKSLKDKGSQQNFLTAFQQMLGGIEQTKAKVSTDLSAEKASLEVLSNKYNKLLEKQRNYFKAVKEFQDECFKNEKLLEALQHLERQ